MSGDNTRPMHFSNLLIHIISSTSSKLPITTSELGMVVDGNLTFLHHILPMVMKTLQEVYSIRMVPVPEESNETRYICYVYEHITVMDEYDAEQQRNLMLLFLILSYIDMSETAVYEEDIMDFLRVLNITLDEDQLYVGDRVRGIITDTFVDQLYLSKQPIMEDDKQRFIYKWGFRSILEFTKLRALKTTEDIMKTAPKELADKHAKALLDAQSKEVKSDLDREFDDGFGDAASRCN